MSWESVKNNNSGSSNKAAFTTFPEGTTIIRIVDDAPHTRWAHWIPSAKRSLTCVGKGCPICEVIKSAKANKIQPQYNSSKKHSINIINRSTGAVEILEQGQTFFEELLDLMQEHGDVTGYDIKVKRRGSDTNTTYRLDAMDPSLLSDEDIKLVEAGRTNLAEYLAPPTVEQMFAIMNGKDPKDVFSSEGNTTLQEDVQLA